MSPAAAFIIGSAVGLCVGFRLFLWCFRTLLDEGRDK